MLRETSEGFVRHEIETRKENDGAWIEEGTSHWCADQLRLMGDHPVGVDVKRTLKIDWDDDTYIMREQLRVARAAAAELKPGDCVGWATKDVLGNRVEYTISCTAAIPHNIRVRINE